MSKQENIGFSSVEDGRKVLDYFNGFHDGFMKRIHIISRDRVEADQSQTCTGVFDVEIDFAHYNYPLADEPFHPYDQIIHAQFFEVQDIFCDLSAGFLGNTITNLTAIPANRRRGGRTDTEPCLGLNLARHFYLEEYRRYELRESQLFTFKEARFFEKRPSE